MADDFCFALLRSTTLQLLQSVGFESVQLSSADTLTDVFGQYMEYLASTVCDYAQLSGRSTGSAFDVMDGLSELSIDLKSLEDWLDSEGKGFEPAWNDQSDPSRALEGIIDVRKDYPDKPLVFEFLDGDVLDDNDGVDSLPSTPTDQYDENTSTTVSQQIQPHMPAPLPDYVPSYLPAFPIIATINNDEEMESNADTKTNETQPIPSSSSTSLPHPLTVKKKKKPITNPFTHITPFEDSFIATDKDAPPPMALSALETVPIATTATNTSATSPPAPSLSLSAQRDMSLKRMMDAHEKNEAQQTKKRRQSIRSLSQIFQQDTQDDASAGTRLFGRSQGLLGDIVRKVAPPLALSTLSTPNLLVDVMTTGSENTATSSSSSSSTSLDKISSSASAPNLITIPTKNSISGSDNQGTSNSGISLTIPARSVSSTTPLSSTPPSAIASSSSTTASVALSNTDKGNRDIFDYDYDENLSNQSVGEHEKTMGTPTASATSPPPPPPPQLLQQSSSTGGPISLASLANKNPKPAKSAKSTKPGRKLTINLSNLQKKSEDISTSSSAQPVGNKPGKFTISLPSKSSPGSNKTSPYTSSHPPSSRSVSSSPSSSSSSAPKIRFTLKPPEPTVKQEPAPPADLPLEQPLASSATTTPKPPSSSYTSQPSDNISTTSNISIAPPVVPEQEQEDMIKCICDHPTIDYGAFMIACDTCGIWFHGSCVGVSELDQVEEWHCQSCSRKSKGI
ncbi:hypothetical protein BCR42DRAFT_451353 [Absidia repens]|uniref:PHD-type domain-containing protein n=1 Tax=Absidia repens TaxID=90262 RepID=A0A1X2IIH4_9FUNG|nr:hypothetical protein BCR42DRAFT_451353 [Absidia repens]